MIEDTEAERKLLRIESISVEGCSGSTITRSRSTSKTA